MHHRYPAAGPRRARVELLEQSRGSTFSRLAACVQARATAYPQGHCPPESHNQLTGSYPHGVSVSPKRVAHLVAQVAQEALLELLEHYRVDSAMVIRSASERSRPLALRLYSTPSIFQISVVPSSHIHSWLS